MKKKITLLWRPAWLPLALLWLGGLLQSPQALAQEHRLDAEPPEAQIERNEIMNTNTPLRIVAPDPQPASLPAADVKRLLGKARKSDVCDTVRVKLSDYVYGNVPIALIFVGEGEGTIDWGDGTKSACEAVEESTYYNWVRYDHSYPEAGGYELTIYTSSPSVRIVGVSLYHYNDNTQYQLVERVDVRACSSLMYLYCGYNQLKTVDVSQNTALKELACHSNQLTELDLSKNTALKTLACQYNQLTSLDLSKNTALKELYCFRNPIGSLDLSKNLNLEVLAVGYEVYSDGRGVGCNLSSLDLSKNVNLKQLYCNNNQLTSLDLSKNTALETLACQYNQLTSLDLSKNTALETLACQYNQLTSLDLSKNTALESLHCFSNPLTSLDLSNNLNLTVLAVGDAVLRDPDIIYLYGYGCQLTSLDLSKNMKLKELYCNHNHLTSLDLSNNVNLVRLHCYDNQLTSLNLSNNVDLEWVFCYNNQLTSLDVSKNVELTRLICQDNRLTTLDVSKNVKLKYLWCSDNALTSIKVMEKPDNLSTYGYFDARNNRLGWADLTALSKMQGEVYLSPQQQTVELTLNGTLDLSEYMTYGGQQTVCDFSRMPASAYEWVDGRLRIKQAGIYNFSMYNPAVRENDGDSVVVNWNITVYPSERDTTRWIWRTAYSNGNYSCRLGVIGDSTFRVDWGDGQDTVLDVSNELLELTHTYSAAGKYEVTVYGHSPRYMLSNLDIEGYWGVRYLAVRSANLHSLDCRSSHALDTLDVSDCANLISLNCRNNSLDTLDVSKNVNLTSLECSFNNLSSLNLSKNVNLTSLSCSSNRLDSLDVSACVNLESLNCSGNRLDSLDVSACVKLTSLNCSNNRLDSLDVSACANLTTLNCSDNYLKALNISRNINLTSLDCSGNRLDSLDVSACVKLWSLDCSSNRLRFLDVSGCEALCGESWWRNEIGLDCSNNQLTSLDLSKNTALRTLDCSNNRMPFAEVAALSAIMQSKNAGLYAFYPQSPASIEVDLQQGLDLSELIPVVDSGSADFRIVLNGDTLSDGRGYSVQDGVIYPNKIGRYSMEIMHEAVKERVIEDYDHGTRRVTRVYVATFDMDVTTSVNDTLRMTWQTLQAEETKSFSFEGMIGGYFVVHWGDGDTLPVVSKGKEVTLSHQYAEAGIYEVVLCGIDSLSYVDTAFLKEMLMVKVQGGTFTMGCTFEQGSDCFDNESPSHRVTLDGFYIGQFEVTQGQWKAVMGTTVEEQRDKAGASSLYGVGDDYPMYYVSWSEAVEFCERLSAKTGRKYRLPTEAEWEYAARGGQNVDGTKYAGSNTVGDMAWYTSNSGGKTHPVGQKQPNGLGLYDMSGNVNEWCSDWYGSYSSSSATNPQGPSSGSYRVLRGGGWYYNAVSCRVSSRNRITLGYRSGDYGFRVVCEL